MRYIASYAMTAVSTLRYVVLAFGRSTYLSWLLGSVELQEGLAEVLGFLAILAFMMRGADNIFMGRKIMVDGAGYQARLVLQGGEDDDGNNDDNNNKDYDSSTKLYAQEYLLAAKIKDLRHRASLRVTVGVAQALFAHGLVLEWAHANSVTSPLTLALAASVCHVLFFMCVLVALWKILMNDLSILSHKKNAFSAVSAHLSSDAGHPDGGLSWFQMDAGLDIAAGKTPDFSFFEALAFVVNVPVQGIAVLGHPLEKCTTPRYGTALRELAIDMHRVEIALLNPLPHLNHMLWQHNYRLACDELVRSIHTNGIAWVLYVLALVGYLPTLLHRLLSCYPPLKLVAAGVGGQVTEGGGAEWLAGQSFGLNISHMVLAMEGMIWVTAMINAWFRRTARKRTASNFSDKHPLDFKDVHYFLEPYFSAADYHDLMAAAQTKKYL